MTCRERVLLSLNHEEPDRVPVYVEYTPEMRRKLLSHLGLPLAEAAEPLLAETLGHDLLSFQVGPVTGFYSDREPEYVDEWGIRWRWVENSAGCRYTEIIGHPAAECGDPAAFPIPAFNVGERYAGCAELIRRHGGQRCIIGSIVCTLFELSWYLRGFSRVLEDMCLNKDFYHAFLDRLLEWALAAGRRLAGLGVDIIYTGDDFGSQSGLLISPAMYREFFKPRYARLYSAIRAVNPGIRLAHHSCGAVTPLVQDFVEIGVQILNPVQPLAMDPTEIKKRFGRRLSLWGAVDEQRVLPFGSRQEVAREVEQRLRSLAPGGGFILSPAHNVQADTPLENVFAFYQAAGNLGNYPINLS